MNTKIQASKVNIQQYCLYARMLQLALYKVSYHLYNMHYRIIFYTITVPCAIISITISMCSCGDEIFSPSQLSLSLSLLLALLNTRVRAINSTHILHNVIHLIHAVVYTRNFT